MIKLSRMSDYAVVVLETLGRDSAASLSASQIAQGSGLPEPTVAKVLKLMAAGGIVTSQRGANGGYTLSRTPREITVYDIVTSIEGRLGLTACVDGGDEPCALEAHCAMSGRWDIVNAAVRTTFQGITLEDMMKPQKKAA
ncbi:MAG: SUF system Fe-S cluster assembly regulator [Alphaproteobacteria bacterium]|nr:SUF system Fe-S cluster assembly regulator [Alphaproteobacteria bacterium]